ncbi:MAG: hydroxymethylglutaryl-CoA lyase [Paracoccaceae bacterium]
MTKSVEIVEVGPRDGLQNEVKKIDLPTKVKLINLLSTAGFKRIEVGSFVNPRLVPQMADSGLVLSNIKRDPSISYAVLVPNKRGYLKAKEFFPNEIAVFCSASEGFSKANINSSIEESLARISEFLDEAKSDGMPVRGYVSCITHCPFDGLVPPSNVAYVVAQLKKLGCYEISLGDTLGRASSDQVDRMFNSVLDEVHETQLAGHFHNTSGNALDNIGVSVERGIRVFDSAVGGLGGCPFAPGAPGNVATEDVLDYVESLGFEANLNKEIINKAGKLAKEIRNV